MQNVVFAGRRMRLVDFVAACALILLGISYPGTRNNVLCYAFILLSSSADMGPNPPVAE